MQKLFPAGIMNKLAPLYSTDGRRPSTIKVPLKLFSPYSGWTWYLYEYSEAEQLFFGLVCGFEKELGLVSQQELNDAVRVVGGRALPLIERDIHWDPDTTLLDVAKREAMDWLESLESDPSYKPETP